MQEPVARVAPSTDTQGDPDWVTEGREHLVALQRHTRELREWRQSQGSVDAHGRLKQHGLMEALEERTLHEDVWRLWLVTGYLPESAYSKTDIVAAIPVIVKDYRHYLNTKKGSAIGALQFEGLERAIEMVKTDAWSLAMDYVFTKVAFDRMYVSSRPYTRRIASEEVRKKMYESLRGWLRTRRKTLRWMPCEFIGGEFVGPDGLELPSKSLADAVRAWKKSKISLLLAND